MYCGYKFDQNLWYPKINKDIMVYTGFRDARRDIPDPPPALEENMDARPDQEEEMEQAINKFLQQLEKQEKKGFKD